MASRDDETLLRRAFEVARRSRANGDHPFGALLAGPDGEMLREQRTATPRRVGHDGARRAPARDLGVTHPRAGFPRAVHAPRRRYRDAPSRPVMASASTRPRALGTALAMLWPAEAVITVLLERRKSDTSSNWESSGTIAI